MSRNMDKQCRSSWTRVHEFLSERRMMQEHHQQSKNKWRRDGYAPMHILKIF
jgi:hypothetical protein